MDCSRAYNSWILRHLTMPSFDSTDFSAVTFDDVVSLVSNVAEESHALEFKRKTDPRSLELHKEDRRLLGEALSGFANATGGIVILGVGSERHHGIDRAKSLETISDVRAVANRVRSYSNECVAPPIDGVKVRALAQPDGTGVILILVPRGQARPHMSTAPGHHTYYRRVMDSFVPMEAYEVEEMMRLKSEPLLQFVYEIRSAGSVGGNRNFSLLFGLENDSKTTAKFPYISYRHDAERPTVAHYGLDGNGNNVWPKINDVAGGATLFAAGADQVLHPHQRLYVSKLDYMETFDPRYRDWGVSKLAPRTSLRLEFQFGCEDSPIDTAILELSREQLLGE